VILQQTFRDLDQGGRVSTMRLVDFPTQGAQAQYLRAVVNTYRNRLPIREKAVAIVRGAGVPPKAKLAQAVAIGRWAQQNLYYVNEPEETFQTPLRTIRSGFGDCDDFTTTIASLCEAIGIPTELVCVGPWPALTHIFPRACIVAGSRIVRVPMDATLPMPIGFDPMVIARRRWPVRAHARVY